MRKAINLGRSALAVSTLLVLGLLAGGCGGEQRATAPSSDGNRMPADVQAEMQKRMGGVSAPPSKAPGVPGGSLYPASGPAGMPGAPGMPPTGK